MPNSNTGNASMKTAVWRCYASCKYLRVKKVLVLIIHWHILGNQHKSGYIQEKSKTINNGIPLWNILMWKINYLTNKKGIISELVYQLKHQNKILNFPKWLVNYSRLLKSNYQWYSGNIICCLVLKNKFKKCKHVYNKIT